jgi:hypothetical protein
MCSDYTAKFCASTFADHKPALDIPEKKKNLSALPPKITVKVTEDHLQSVSKSERELLKNSGRPTLLVVTLLVIELRKASHKASLVVECEADAYILQEGKCTILQKNSSASSGF